MAGLTCLNTFLSQHFMTLRLRSGLGRDTESLYFVTAHTAQNRAKEPELLYHEINVVKLERDVAVTTWTFLTNHAQVLLCLAQNGGRMTAREIASTVGITERAVQRIVDDLEDSGYVSRFRDGRNNRYEIHPDLPMRHPLQKGLTIKGLLELLTTPDR